MTLEAPCRLPRAERRRGWISMDCALYDEDLERVYLWEITL